MEEQHLLSLGVVDEDSSFNDYNSSGDDSSVEITSTIDEYESELVRLSTYLQLESDEDDGDDVDQVLFSQHFTWVDKSPVSIRTLPEFIFDPSIVTSPTTNVDDDEEKEESNEQTGRIKRRQEEQNETAEFRSIYEKKIICVRIFTLHLKRNRDELI